MQIYSGPVRRVLRKLKDNTATSFTVDGVVNQEEERAVFVRQKFTLKQFEKDSTILEHISNEWTLPEERGQFDVRVGNSAENTGDPLPLPFSEKHKLSDRLLLNKSFNKVYFKPDNAHNFLDIENRAQARMAPLLCSTQQFENVTVPPRITGIPSYEAQNTVKVPFHFYGKHWFGSLHSMGHAGIDNRTGDAPYYVENNANVAAANPELYSAYGFDRDQLFASQHLVDEKGFITFRYIPERDIYKSDPFVVKIPKPLNQGEFYAPLNLEQGHGHPAQDAKPGRADVIKNHKKYTCPSIETASLSGGPVRGTKNVTPYNYWKIHEVDDIPVVAHGLYEVFESRPRKNFPPPYQDFTTG